MVNSCEGAFTKDRLCLMNVRIGGLGGGGG